MKQFKLLIICLLFTNCIYSFSKLDTISVLTKNDKIQSNKIDSIKFVLNQLNSKYDLLIEHQASFDTLSLALIDKMSRLEENNKVNFQNIDSEIIKINNSLNNFSLKNDSIYFSNTESIDFINNQIEEFESESNTYKSEIKNFKIYFFILMGIISIVFLLFFFLFKMIYSNNKKLIQYHKLDSKLIEILNTQNDLISKASNSDTQKIIFDVADEITNMENNMFKMEKSSGVKRIKRAINNIRNNFKNMGYDIKELVGKEILDGDIIEIHSQEDDESLEKGQKIIVRVIKPRIDFNDKMIQRAKVSIIKNE